ncbi:outer membrane protein assembly factor BamB family protein [Stratiformator vulcanicus]|uniref:Pyrrolo-quinoline quinone repeat domain-containing protein n=1 Tax=Stratiformator vulcanicus TaxID=2527980 RepID=A0A517R5W3_9PLAN|nr:PQQ-binding-like beta-propeller repeat protein [Stratiformator vulcanicus]QDT39250.1 hypothetical protein Pan189_36540 [Stratiformator vulcanicus]
MISNCLDTRLRVLVVAIPFAICLLLDNPAHAQVSRTLFSESQLQNSLQLPIDQDMSRNLERVREVISRGQFDDAVRAIGTLLDAVDQSDVFVTSKSNGQAVISLRHELARLIDGLPPEGQRIYELQFGVAAQRYLNDAIAEGSIAGLTRAATLFPQTEAGHVALFRLSAALLDRGRHGEAADCMRRFMEQVDQSEINPQHALLAVVAEVRSGRLDRAEALLERFPLLSEAISRLASSDDQNADGKETDVAVLLRHFARGVPQPHSSHASVDDLPLRVAEWSVTTGLLPAETADIADARDSAIRSGVAPLSTLSAVVSGDLLLLPTISGFDAIAVESGERLWSYRSASTRDDYDDMFWGNSPAGKIVARPGIAYLLEPASENQFGLHSSDKSAPVANGNQLLFGGVWRGGGLAMPFNGPVGGGFVVQQRDGNEAPGKSSVSFASDGRVLTALRADRTCQGKILWQVGGPSSRFEPLLAGHDFLGTPLAERSRLFALTEYDRSIFLNEIDGDTGRLTWSVEIGQIEVAIGMDPVRRNSAVTPHLVGGNLICPTGAGGIVAVDPTTRSLQWAYRYPRTAAPSGRRNRRFNRQQLQNLANVSGPTDKWDQSQLVVAGERVFVATPENNELHCLELGSGQLHWRRSRKDGRRIMAAENGLVSVFGNRHFTGLDPETGEQKFHQQWPDGTVPTGEPLAGEAGLAYLPLSDASIVEVDPRSGAILSRKKTSREHVLGNLHASDSGIVSVAPDYIKFYRSGDDARRLASGEQGDLDEAERLALAGDIATDRSEIDEAVSQYRLAYELDPQPKWRSRLERALLDGVSADSDQAEEYAERLDELAR